MALPIIYNMYYMNDINKNLTQVTEKHCSVTKWRQSQKGYKVTTEDKKQVNIL